MRELIYLSQRKLEQFQIDRRGGGLAKRVREIGIKAPLGLGEVKVDLSDVVANHYPQLAKVLKELDRSDRAPRWYEEDGLEPGDWVQFEAPLNCILLNVRKVGLDGGLIFLQPPPPAREHATVRLFLHGAPHHLIGGHEGEVRPGWLSPSLSYRFFRLLEKLFADEVRPVGGAASLVATTVYELDREHYSATASWMAGYARVTMRTVVQNYRESEPTTFLVATPLFVEYASKPEGAPVQ